MLINDFKEINGCFPDLSIGVINHSFGIINEWFEWHVGEREDVK